MRPVVLAALICLLGGVPASAQNAFATNGARVYPLDSNVYEVVGNSGGGYRLFWCGAGEYARRVLGASWSSQISIVRGLGPSQATNRRSAVQFTLNPDAAGVTPMQSPRLNAYDVGDTKSVNEASGYCNEIRFRQR